METKRLPIGVEDFATLIRDEYYFIDKTLFIRDLLDSKGMVNLFTRPRRFGKTLNLSMLRHFFELAEARKDNRSLFRGLAIEKAGDSYFSHFGKYPVINLTLKSAKQPGWQLSYDCLINAIVMEYERHRFVVENSNKLSQELKERYFNVIRKTADQSDYVMAIQFLSVCLEKVYGEKVVILIDEYDVPLENAYFNGFYDQMVGFLRSLFESALKTNDALAFAVMTGCLRISKESIFTGLNNLKINSIRQNRYAKYFGFSTGEVNRMLADFEMAERSEEVKKWYNGYYFGTTEVYNPWSIINYVSDVQSQERVPMPYWSNTSGNSIVHSLLERADDEVKMDLELLTAGETIEKPIHEDMTYQEIYDSTDNIWNFLYFTGYLTKVREERRELTDWMTFQIPNDEIRYIYQNQISNWMKKMVSGDHRVLYEAVFNGQGNIVEEEINKILINSISYLDSAESFYHGVMTGIFSGIFKQAYRMVSNRESGTGRPDLLFIPANMKKPGIVMELKASETIAAMEGDSQKAMAQIKVKNYEEELKQNGCKEIFFYGISFFRKNCMVLSKKY